MTAAQFDDVDGRALVEAIVERVENQRIDLTTPGVRYAPTFDHNAPLPPAPNYRPREWETTDKETR